MFSLHEGLSTRLQLFSKQKPFSPKGRSLIYIIFDEPLRHLYSSQAPGSRQHNRPSCYGSPHLYYYLPYPMTPHPTANMPTSLVLMPQVYESWQPQLPTEPQHHLKHCHAAKYESRACHLSHVSSSVTNTFAKTVSFSLPIPMMQTLNPSHMSHTTSTTIYFYKSPKHNSNVRLDPENSLQQDKIR